jgi:hypothetical protein
LKNQIVLLDATLDAVFVKAEELEVLALGEPGAGLGDGDVDFGIVMGAVFDLAGADGEDGAFDAGRVGRIAERGTKFRPRSKSTKVSVPQTARLNSSRVTTSPACSSSIARACAGWACNRTGMPSRRNSRVAGSKSNIPKRRRPITSID